MTLSKVKFSPQLRNQKATLNHLVHGHFSQQKARKEAMPHFDPERSTTNDVVRHVVIPRSRDGDVGVAFAEKLKPTKVSRELRRGRSRS